MTELKFKPGYRSEADEWTCDGERITAPEKLAAIKKVLEKDGPILVQHKFLRGARAPHEAVFDDYEEFLSYLSEHARAGDKISVWSLWPFMRDTPALAHGKCPAEDGTILKRGAYWMMASAMNIIKLERAAHSTAPNGPQQTSPEATPWANKPQNGHALKGQHK